MNNNIEKNYLGIDWGVAKVGIALSDEETRMAFSYATLKNDKNFLKNLLEIIFKEKIGTIVIGVPIYKNKKKETFGGKKLEEIIEKNIKNGVKIKYQNEMFSTKIAERNLIERGAKKIKRFDDAEAARIILESWLSENSK